MTPADGPPGGTARDDLMTAAQEHALAELQRANAELRRERDLAVAQAAALGEVLRAIAASPDDPQPVFELIARRARDLCGAASVAICEYDGTLLHLRMTDGHDATADERRRQAFPRVPGPDSFFGRALLENRTVHIRDWQAEPTLHESLRGLGVKSAVHVPLRRDGRAIGVIGLGRFETGGFDDAQVALVESFAEQASLAIAGAATLRELRARTGDLQQALEQQTATADVLGVINRSPGDLVPVFEAILEKAHALCGVTMGALLTYENEMVRAVATRGYSSRVDELARLPRSLEGTLQDGLARGERFLHYPDVQTFIGQFSGLGREFFDSSGARTYLNVPLRRDGVLVGIITAIRTEVRPFSEKEIILLESFAAQAVIAMENARLLGELRERTAALAQRNSEYGERIEQQAATIDVLKVMSASPGDPQPVFDLIVRRAKELCNGNGTCLHQFDGELVNISAFDVDAYDPALPTSAAYLASFPMPPDRGSIICRAILDRQIMHVRDVEAVPELSEVMRQHTRGWARSQLSISLLLDGRALGAITLASPNRGGFTDSQVALLQTFAEQAVIAITSVANFRALRERTEALARSVAELQALEEVLRAVNSSLDLDTVLETIVSRAVRLSRSDEGTIYEFDATEQVFVPKSAYGMSAERVALLRDRRIRLGETHLGRSAVLRAPVFTDDVQHDASITNAAEALPGIHAVLAVPLLRDDTVIGGLVIRRRTEAGFPPATVTLMQTFAGQAVLAIENARLFQELAARGDEARRARVTTEATLTDLRRTQDRLVQTEKLASLGQLTAGIAHEIKNPLNFVNNFSDLSVDLLDELHEAVAPDKLDLTPELRAEIDDLTTTLKGNLERIAQHGRRADSIVKNMLLHSRSGPSEHRPIDLNATVEEALNLAYHGARAETPGFNITLEKHLDPHAGSIEAFPQEFIRVMLNLIGNGFYAARKRAERGADKSFEPTLTLTTRDLGAQVEIRVRDNGTGIPQHVWAKIFEPFFTTKPAGEGTGLGLSLSHDIVVKQHNGQLTVDSQIDTFTEFAITLPRRMAATEGAPPMIVRVLVVDDEPDVETLFRQQFRREVRQGLYSLDFALSGPVALDKLAGHVGDDIILLVSDINMPGMSGLELLPMVKQRRPDLPVFMISAYGDKDTIATALERGASKFMAKPVDFPRLKQDVSTAIADARGGG